MHVSEELIKKYHGKSTQWLDKELWRLFSLWVRQLYLDHRGITRCVTCGAFRHWRQMDAGHYMSRRHMATKFSEYNVHVQCKPCNGPEGGGKPEQMKRYINRRFGPGTAQHLEALSKQAVKFGRLDYIQLIEHYKKKLIEHNYELR